MDLLGRLAEQEGAPKPCKPPKGSNGQFLLGVVKDGLGFRVWGLGFRV